MNCLSFSFSTRKWTSGQIINDIQLFLIVDLEVSFYSQLHQIILHYYSNWSLRPNVKNIVFISYLIESHGNEILSGYISQQPCCFFLFCVCHSCRAGQFSFFDFSSFLGYSCSFYMIRSLSLTKSNIYDQGSLYLHIYQLIHLAQ